jgi:hypothetical protein
MQHRFPEFHVIGAGAVNYDERPGRPVSAYVKLRYGAGRRIATAPPKQGGDGRNVGTLRNAAGAMRRDRCRTIT